MTKVNYHYEWLTDYKPQQTTIICLHGFTGSLETFRKLPFSSSYNYLGIDLIGHGLSSVYVHPDNYRIDTVVAQLCNLMTELKLTSYYLLGYSMGGRVALAWGLDDPQVQGIILENASPGLENDFERQQRMAKDNHLAQRLLTEHLTKFVDFWENLPLFDSQKKLAESDKQRIRQERLNQESFGLAMSLMMMGTGQQPSLWAKLSQSPPTLFISGKLDFKFQKIAKHMQQRNPQLTIQTLAGGHCVHLECPLAFVETVENWIGEQVQ